MLLAFLQGFGTGGGLIVAIGAQNVFVLSQAVRKNHHILVAGICIISDVLLIGLGVHSVGTAVAASPLLTNMAGWLGAIFLGWYGVLACRRAFSTNRLAINSERKYSTVRSAVLATLMVTYLNPHVYLDTIVLMGAVSGQLDSLERLLFWGGAGCASTLWFMGLAFAGQALAPFFAKPQAWRILDGSVCLVMWALATKLLYGVAV